MDPQQKIELNVYQRYHIAYAQIPVGLSNSFKADGANSVTFKNLGTATARIDKILPLPPNVSISFNGNIGERLTNIFTFDWTTAGTKNILVIIKEYQ